MGTFGDTLKGLLDERGMSQAELGRRLGLTPQAVSSWITGGTTPSRENVGLVEDELAVEPRGSLLAAAGWAHHYDECGPTVESLIRADPGLAAEDKRIFLRLLRMARDRFAAESQ